MNFSESDDLSHLSILELFRVEAENQTAILTAGLLELERQPKASQPLETLMRAAHSLKGAARIVNFDVAVRVAHGMEDCFVATQRGTTTLSKREIDTLLRAVDCLQHLSRYSEATLATWEAEHSPAVSELLASLQSIARGRGRGGTRGESRSVTNRRKSTNDSSDTSPPWLPVPMESGRPATAAGPRKFEPSERVLRLTAENLNRLLGLAGEALVESRWVRPFADSLQRLKRQQAELAETLDHLRNASYDENLSERTRVHLNEMVHKLADSQHLLEGRLQELDLFDHRAAHLSNRLYLEVLRTRMRPFGDGVRRFPRMVRDLAHSLGKEIKLEIFGEHTQVDRDILERLEAPLAHLLRNAVDHGCETQEDRERAGKPPEGVIRLEARHNAGMLVVTVMDDGAGVDSARVREAVLQKGLAAPTLAEKLTEAELLEFLFLPGFTLKETVTEISGRGVGLDVVQNMVKAVRGNIRVNNQPGRGIRFQLQLPLTLSVLRTLLVEVAGEPYAIPLSQISSTLKLARRDITVIEGRQHLLVEGQPVGLLTAHQVFDCEPPRSRGGELPVVVLGSRATRFGLIVDKLLGERELVVQPLDSRLGKVQDISAAALMEDGSPVLIVDVDDVLRSIEKLAAGGLLAKVSRAGPGSAEIRPKHILAVDDSRAVRELERKLLTAHGYVTDVAEDGMEAWNAVRTGQYDLVITDVDMPRLDGIELAAMIKNDPELKNVPVLIVSYKDREKDRFRGLEAGADYYLTKSTFHAETLLQTVVDLIGEADA
jgi:two-component system sensor histidine kinase and response regulator WspE